MGTSWGSILASMGSVFWGLGGGWLGAAGALGAGIAQACGYAFMRDGVDGLGLGRTTASIINLAISISITLAVWYFKKKRKEVKNKGTKDKEQESKRGKGIVEYL